MFKKISLVIFSIVLFSSMTNAAFASSKLIDVLVQYHADCPSKDYPQCAKDNKKIQLKNIDTNTIILAVKDLIFKNVKTNDEFMASEKNKFLPTKNQIITCADKDRWPNDNDNIDVCGIKDNKVVVDLHLN